MENVKLPVCKKHFCVHVTEADYHLCSNFTAVLLSLQVQGVFSDDVGSQISIIAKMLMCIESHSISFGGAVYEKCKC